MPPASPSQTCLQATAVVPAPCLCLPSSPRALYSPAKTRSPEAVAAASVPRREPRPPLATAGAPYPNSLALERR
ncbi:hypothetical protein M0R45_000058 [Rubus argutus]|uniref:Uncharacterized protein n=1 Tax=Rubus argutus TaxID=59490 RepID=A0AAW1VQF7_RUBAR